MSSLILLLKELSRTIPPPAHLLKANPIHFIGSSAFQDSLPVELFMVFEFLHRRMQLAYGACIDTCSFVPMWLWIHGEMLPECFMKPIFTCHQDQIL